MSEIEKEATITLAGGRITCARCQAMSKRSREQCRKPALSDKRVCQIHGGKSTGARTEEGRQRVAQAHLKHGEETRARRKQASANSAYLHELEDVAWALGMMTGGRTRGRKPKNYQPAKTAEDARLWIFLDASGLRGKVKF
jgi:hypothetical protein